MNKKVFLLNERVFQMNIKVFLLSLNNYISGYKEPLQLVIDFILKSLIFYLVIFILII
jgi:hypothetical protein